MCLLFVWSMRWLKMLDDRSRRVRISTLRRRDPYCERRDGGCGDYGEGPVGRHLAM